MTAATYRIERAVRADAEAMLDLQLRAFAEEGRRSGTREIPPLMETLTRILDHIDHHVALVARDGRTVIGAVRGLLEGDTCTIRTLAVEPARQGQGIGTALLRTLEDSFPDVKRFDLTTNMVMEGNVPFYERHGYQVFDTTRHSEIVTLAHMSRILRR